MPPLATAAAVVLYLIPVAVVLAARARRERPLWGMALDLPLAVALDLLVVLLLTVVLPLEQAVLVSRAGWLGGGALLLRRRGPSRWPAALDRRALGAALATALVTTALSLLLSRPYAIWDRYWHFPLVSSIAAQRLPFHNVFQPELVLRYHFAGNVLAAELQALSLRTLHASLALSLAHDVVFGLLGGTLALLFLSAGYRGAVATALAALGVLLNGPFWFFRDGLGKAYEGYSYLNYYEMSYRPHISLEGLFLTAIAAAVAVRLRAPRESVPVRETAPPLVAAFAALAITDEASTVLLGLAVAAAWVVEPDAVHPRRLPGLGLLALAGAGTLAANVAFSASLSPGGPAHALAWVAARAPGFYNEGPRPLTTPEGRRALFFDTAALLAFAAGFVALFLRRVGRARGALLAFVAALGGVSVLLLTHVDVNRAPLECHRFMTAPTFVFPLLALLWLAELPRHAAERLLFAGAVALPAFGTALWAAELCPKDCLARLHFGKQDFYATDCRAATGARLGEAAAASYVAQPIIGLYTGCRPLFISGGEKTYWGELRTGGPFSGLDALRWIEAGRLPVGGVVHAACDPEDQSDPVCRYAVVHGLCRREGTLVFGCELGADDRRRLLGPR